MSKYRPLHEIAKDIRKNWKWIYGDAERMVEYMSHLNTIEDSYNDCDANYIISRFMDTSLSWSTETSCELKYELNRIKYDYLKDIRTFNVGGLYTKYKVGCFNLYGNEVIIYGYGWAQECNKYYGTDFKFDEELLEKAKSLTLKYRDIPNKSYITNSNFSDYVNIYYTYSCLHLKGDHKCCLGSIPKENFIEMTTAMIDYINENKSKLLNDFLEN